MSSRRPTSTTVLLAILLLASSCGGGGGEAEGRDPATWTSSFCTSMSAWVQGIQGSAEGLEGDFDELTPGDFEGLKDLMVGFVDEAVRRTDELIEQVEGLGAPAVEEGGEVVATVVGALREIGGVFAEARDVVGDLPVDDPEVFFTGLQEVGSAIQRGTESATGVLDEAERSGLGGEELSEAFENAPACRGLVGGGAEDGAG